MKELEMLKERYIVEGKLIAKVYGELNEETLRKVITNLSPYEKPDILSIYDDRVIGIEHFEFDSYDNSKKGSDYKIKDNKIKENFDKKVKEEMGDSDEIMVKDEIKSTSSIKNYCKNFKRVFQTHYKKINSYINHIKEDYDCMNKEISICFIVEDVTPFGSFYTKNDKIYPVLPFHFSVLRKLLINSPLVKYLIIGMYVMDKHELFIIENTKKSIETIEKDIDNISEKDFLIFNNIQSISCSIIIKESELIGYNEKTI